jgi:hypothetical protein
MIEPKPGSYEKWLPVSKSLGGGQENLFFHADVTEKPGSKLLIRSPINLVGMSHSRLKQFFKPPMVCHKKGCERSCLFVLSWAHLPPPITLSSSCRHPDPFLSLTLGGATSTCKTPIVT